MHLCDRECLSRYLCFFRDGPALRLSARSLLLLFLLHEMPDALLAHWRAIWQPAGRPDQGKSSDAARRKGVRLTVREAADFVRAQPVSQVLSAPPKSAGKVTSPELNERWQCDLIDYKAKSPEQTLEAIASFSCA